MAQAMLAPPAAGSTTGPGATQRAKTLTLAAVIGAGAGAMLFAGLIAAHLALKANTPAWPAKGIKFDYYLSATLIVTVALSLVTIEWAAYGIRHGYRGQSLWAFVLTIGFGLAYLNGLYYLIAGFGLQPGKTAYGTSVSALTAAAFAAGLVGLGAVLLAAFRAAGHQLTMVNYQVMRATAWVWHVAAGAVWTAVFYFVFIAH
jgi:heme/copper-type cytochrome/quinol oxidase subunit 3